MPATNRIALFLVSLGLALGLTAVSAVTQPLSDPAGQADLAVALRQLNSTGTFLSVTAHPDDENNALLARLARGDGHRTVLLSLTRGDGGQNEIGPELFDALAVLRTEELAAAHRLDGAEQYFSRAVDFGYSFSVEETFERWGHEEILSDIVRMIRTVRPDVISAMSPEGRGGGQHHQASAILAHEAYHAAADPARFPEQIADGLRPWQARKFYFRSGFPFGMGIGPPGFANRRGDPDPALTTIDLAGFDPLLGATWTELGSRARSMHKCQGMSQFVALPAGAAGGRYRLAETAIAGYAGGSGESSLFDGVDTSIGALARFAGTSPPGRLVDDLDALAMDARDALEGFESEGVTGAREPVLNGLLRTRLMRTALETGMYGVSDEARAAIDLGLTRKERQFEHAALLAHAVRLEVLADDGIVAPGQPIRLRALVANLGDDAVTVQGIRLDGLDGVAGADVCATALAAGDVQECGLEARIPPDARMTDIHWAHVAGADRYELDPDVPFGLPFRPTPFRATFDLRLGSAAISVERRVEYRYGDDLFTGEKRVALQVVPRVAVSMTPAITVVPVAATGDAAAREVRVTATHTGPIAPGRPVTGSVRLELPSGWVSEPASATVAFGREDESRTVRFRVTTGGAPTGEYAIRATVDVAGAAYDRGYQVIEYPHTSRRHIGRPATATVHVLDVAVAPDLLVGYIEGVGDAVPPAIEQLGAQVEFIDADGLAWGDLERFDVIVTGVRAYERRDDLRANNNRLLEYVEAGGTVIVQYNKFEFNEAQYGPWPAQVGRGRVTDERSSIRILANDHPVFAWPNRVGAATWENWVQERGLYFLADRDERYTDLVELEDTFEYNPGVKRGALVEARPGQGRWIYLGLGLWRQLPAGTPGAYTLLANLLSLGEGDGR